MNLFNLEATNRHNSYNAVTVLPAFTQTSEILTVLTVISNGKKTSSSYYVSDHITNR